MVKHGWFGDCQSNSSVQGYSDVGRGGIGVAIHGRSMKLSTDGFGDC